MNVVRAQIFYLVILTKTTVSPLGSISRSHDIAFFVVPRKIALAFFIPISSATAIWISFWGKFHLYPDDDNDGKVCDPGVTRLCFLDSGLARVCFEVKKLLLLV